MGRDNASLCERKKRILFALTDSLLAPGSDLPLSILKSIESLTNDARKFAGRSLDRQRFARRQRLARRLARGEWGEAGGTEPPLLHARIPRSPWCF